jgi:hypothetical protein
MLNACQSLQMGLQRCAWCNAEILDYCMSTNRRTPPEGGGKKQYKHNFRLPLRGHIWQVVAAASSNWWQVPPGLLGWCGCFLLFAMNSVH